MIGIAVGEGDGDRSAGQIAIGVAGVADRDGRRLAGQRRCGHCQSIIVDVSAAYIDHSRGVDP